MADKKVYHTYEQCEEYFLHIMRDIQKDGWRPDYVVGLNRGGLFPGVWASHWLGVPHYSLGVSLRDNDEIGPETNCWMAEDAFGYDGEDITVPAKIKENGKNILIIDDINDTGATFDWIKDDWAGSCLPKDTRWDDVWGKNVRTAVLIDNLMSNWKVDYCGIEINKKMDPSWVVFPWERFSD